VRKRGFTLSETEIRDEQTSDRSFSLHPASLSPTTASQDSRQSFERRGVRLRSGACHSERSEESALV
jgi:hypothetical protein